VHHKAWEYHSNVPEEYEQPIASQRRVFIVSSKKGRAFIKSVKVHMATQK
jgi:hypothetical protein